MERGRHCDLPEGYDVLNPALWQVTPGQALRHHGWGDEFVLYNDLSGDTHLLGAGAIDLLLALQSGAASEAGLAAALGQPGEPDAPAIAAQVGALLAELATLFLVEQVTAC